MRGRPTAFVREVISSTNSDVIDRLPPPSVLWDTPSSFSVATSSTPPTTPSVPAAPEVLPTFEPVLNVPALGTFVFIAVVFGTLRWRVGQIESAARDRTRALEELRQAQAAALERPDAAVPEALDNYRRAYERVEELRNVIPNTDGLVKITTPSTSLSSSRIAREHAQAAEQFLGIEQQQQSQQSTPPSLEKGASPSSIPLPLLAVLSMVLLSQLGLLTLFLQDPLATSSSPL